MGEWLDHMSVNHSEIQKLIFIYNADSGVRNLLLDTAHKIFNPSTYMCSLCDITFGAFVENSSWRRFRKDTDLQMEFLHKDEFTKVYQSKLEHKFSFPIVLAVGAKGLEVFIKTEALNQIINAEELIALIKERSL